MRCVVNLLTGRFVESRGVSALPRMFEHKRGDSGEVRLEFCEGFATATIPAGSEIVYGVKLRGEYDSAPLMTVTNFVLESGIYVGTAAFDLDAIDAALNLDADAANDLEMLDCMAEVSWKPPGGGWLSTNTQLARILNDVNRTDDSLIERIADIPARWASATLSDLGVAGPMNSGAQIVVDGLALWFVEMAGEEEPGDGYVLNEGGLTVAEVLLEFEAYINDGEPVAAGSSFVLRDGTWDDSTALIVDGALVVSTNTAGVGGNALAVSLNGAAATEVEWDGATMTGGRASKSFDSGDFIATFEREPGSELTDEEQAIARAELGLENLKPGILIPDGAQFLIEGDSIFSDLSVSQSSHPPRWGSFFQTSKLFAERGFLYTNSAVPGNGLVELEARFAATGAAQAVATGTATVIVCNVGVNDLAAGEMEGSPWANAAAWIADYEALAQAYRALSTDAHPVYFVACTMVKYRNKNDLRKEVNDLIRTSKVFDMVVDHALILTDEDDLNFYIPNTAGGASPTDETHPNERGAYYQFREIMRRLFPEVGPLVQEDLLTDFEGLYSRLGQIPRNFATLNVYANDDQAGVAGLGYRDAYLKSTGEMAVVMTAPPTITTHAWTEASNSTRIQNFTTTNYAAYNEIDIQLTAFDPTRFIYLQSGHTVGTRLYLRNSTGSVTGADATHKIGIRPWATNVSEILNENGPNGMTDALSTDYVLGAISPGTYVELESISGSVLQWRVVEPV
jgi:hypothetical protein